MKFGYFLVIFLVSFSNNTFCQELWTLEKCINYAIENNLQVRQAVNNQFLAKKYFLIAKTDFLPSLNASTNSGYNWGRNFDSNTFLFTNERTSSSGFAVSASMDIFSGFSKYNTLKQKKEEYNLSKYYYVNSLNEMMLQIASAYMKILFDVELVGNVQKQLNISRLQLEQTEKLVKAGSLPKGDLFNMQAQVASEELNVINAENDLERDYLYLEQILDIDADVAFKIAKPLEIDVATEKYPVSLAVVYETAKDSLPEIKIAKSNLEIARLKEKIARGRYSPSLTGSGYTRSSSSSSFPDEFNQQLKDNKRDYVGLTLNFPIFNNLQNNYTVSTATIDVKNKELSLDIAYNDLRKTLQLAYQDMLAAQKKYVAANNQMDALKEAYNYAEQKYKLGMLNTVDFADAKNKYNKSESDLLQARFDYIFKTKVLDFYRGKPLRM